MAILSPLYNLPNNVLQKQKAYQNDHRPIMMRGARGKLYFGIYSATFTVGMIGTLFAVGSLIKGKSTE